MYSKLSLVSILFLILSCSSDDGPSEGAEEEKKYLSSFLNGQENTADSLVYFENRLVLRKEYIDDFLDYNYNYSYNSSHQLVKMNRIHSNETYPSEETNYTYYEDGTLKSRKFQGFGQNYTQNFTYRDNLIYINEGENETLRMSLNESGLIVAVDKFYEEVNEFANILKLEYDTNANVTKASARYDRQSSYRVIKYSFDDKINPLFVFDSKLPNGLTIKQLEAFNSFPNFGGYSPGDDDNMIVYFNKNNFTSVEFENGTFHFMYEYDAKGYPTKITLPYNGERNITLSYKP